MAREDSGLLFVRLLLDDSGVKLLEAIERPGHFKTPVARGKVEFEITSETGAILHSGAMLDPLVTRLEYEDPDNPGHIAVKEIRRPSAEFMLRLPSRPQAASLRFFRRTEPAPGQITAQAERQFLGEVQLKTGK